jgi:hypothetical protein
MPPSPSHHRSESCACPTGIGRLHSGVSGEHGTRRSLTTDFVHFTSSEVAPVYEPGGKGQPPAAISSRALGATHEQIARPREGGFIGRALQPLHSARPSNRSTPSSTPA